ncbi:glycosyltransferase family 9 protein [Desulfosoma sp.]|uniref:glycosyltransferase family 9 protein n=1 Tax=Desulfosoma sp. TaxID=2603217 RepID=UPI00404916E7
MIRTIWHIFMFATDHLVFLVPARTSMKSSDVLIIKPDKMGDFVVWLDAAREFKECFKEHKLVLVVDQSLAVLARKVGIFDEIVPFSFSKFGEDIIYRLKSLLWLRRRAFYAAISISRSFRYVDVMVRLSSSIEKIGPNGNEALTSTQQELRLSDKWYSKIIELKKRRETNAFEMNLAFVEALGAKIRKPRIPILDRIISEEFKKHIGTSYVVFVLGAASSLRRWPVESFALVAKRLLNETPYSILLCGTPSERILAHRFVSMLGCPNRNRVMDETGRTQLTDLVTLLSGAICVVSNETGTLHLSASVGTPSVCIAGGGDFGHLVPYPEVLDTCGRPTPIIVFEKMSCFGCGWKCIYQLKSGMPAPCISAVRVDSVWESLMEAFKFSRNLQRVKYEQV